MKFTITLVAIFSSIAGFALGRWSQPEQSIGSTKETNSTPLLVAHADGRCDSSTLTAFAAQVRSDVHAELTGFKSSLSANATPATVQTQSHVSTEQLQAQALSAERANSTVDAALARHQWTDSDAQTLRAEIDTMSQEQRQAVLSKLAMAINQGQLTPETERFPF